MKIAIVSTVFNTCNTADISNYHPISVLPCFSKILECVIHNCLYNCLADEKILYAQHFGFRKGDPIEHAIVQLIDQIYKSFENNNIPLVLTRSTIQCFWKSLRSKEMSANLAWFRSYVTNRKLYICINNTTKTNEQKVILGHCYF